jgi:hypothetical protein
MRLVVPKPLVTFAPASKTITLASPFNKILEVDVLRIRDDTTSEVIYDRNNPKYGITVTDGIITYTYNSDHQAADDDLQVELEFGYYAPKIAVFTTQAIAASATLSPSSKIYVQGADSIWIFANNAGASTSVSVNVYPYADSTASAGAVVLPLTISNTVQATSIVETGLPYISVGAVNNDASNAASLNVTLVITWR